MNHNVCIRTKEQADGQAEVQDVPRDAHPHDRPQDDEETIRAVTQASPGTSITPLRSTMALAYTWVELNDIEPPRPEHAAQSYEQLLSVIQRYFYRETKAIASRDNVEFFKSGESGSTLALKAHLVSSYYVLSAQEDALKVTTLTSLIEFAMCCAVAIALGVVVYIEGSTEWSTIASYVLFAVCLSYKTLGWIAYLVSSKVNVKEDEYKRLVMEARERLGRRSDFDKD